jgi:hypothetical protein
VGLSYSWGLPTRTGRSGSGGAPASGADADFLTRRTSPGVLRYFDFNDAAQIDGEYGDNYGITTGAGTVALDTTVKASGASSLKFGLTAGGHASGGNSCSFFTNFTDDLQRFGGGTEFFYQFKVRLSTEAFEDWSHKFFLVGSGDDGVNTFSSCTDLEIEMEHRSNSGSTVNAINAFPIMYNACPGSCGGTFNFFESGLPGSDFDLQPHNDTPYCSYNDATKADCVRFVAEQWMVFQVGVTVGTKITDGGHYWFQGSRVRLWMQEAPGETEQLIIDWLTDSITGSEIGLCAGHGATGDQQYGKLWLLPYTQNSIGGGARAASVWYDELIIGEQKIPAALA